MGTLFFKKQPYYMKRCADYRYKCLGGHAGAASDVRRIDPHTGEVVEIIARQAQRKNRLKRPARPTRRP